MTEATTKAETGTTFQLTKGILSVVHAAHPEVSRYSMNGVYIDHDGTAVATDGKIMATLRNGTSYQGITPRVLDSKSVSKLRSKLGRKADVATLAMNPETREERAEPKGKCSASDRLKNGKCKRASGDYQCPRCYPPTLTLEDVTIRTGKTSADLGAFPVAHVIGHYPPYRDVLPKMVDGAPLPRDYPIKLEMDRATLEDISAPFDAWSDGYYCGAACRWQLYPDCGDGGELRVTARHVTEPEGRTLNLTLETGKIPTIIRVEGGNYATNTHAAEIGMAPGLTLALCRVAQEAGIDKLTIYAKDARAPVILIGKSGHYTFLGLQMPLNTGA